MRQLDSNIEVLKRFIKMETSWFYYGYSNKNTVFPLYHNCPKHSHNFNAIINIMKPITCISSLCFLLTLCVSSARIATLDYLVDLTFTNQIYWNNYIGITLDFEQVRDIINSTAFQQYFHNSNLQNDWNNNLFATLRIPPKWNYNCPYTAPNITVIVNDTSNSSNSSNSSNDSFVYE